jgi:hypothetical protein
VTPSISFITGRKHGLALGFLGFRYDLWGNPGGRAGRGLIDPVNAVQPKSARARPFPQGREFKHFIFGKSWVGWRIPALPPRN